MPPRVPPSDGLQVKASAELKRKDKAGHADDEGSEVIHHRKKKSRKLTDDVMPPKATEFRGYDLSHLPLEALPEYGREYKGLHSYTVTIQDAVSQLLSEGFEFTVI